MTWTGSGLELDNICMFRFAEFVEGSPHLTENEVMEYSHWEYNTDDEDDDDNNDHEQDLYTDDEEVASDEHQDY